MENIQYKYTNETRHEISDDGNYQQYVDLHALYNEQKEKCKEYDDILGLSNYDVKLEKGITIIAGMTGHGKSMLGNSIAYRAIKKDQNVMYISLEISKEDIFYQMLSIKSFHEQSEGSENCISHSDIKKRNLNDKQESYVFDELWPSFKSLEGQLYVVTEWDFNPNSTASLQKKMFEVNDYAIKNTGHGIDMVIVDYIQLFKGYDEKKTVTDYDVLTQWISDFRKMAFDFLGTKREIPIILLSQLNREAWEYAEKNKIRNKSNNIVFGLYQIAGSVEIAKSASVIMTVYMDDNYKASNQCIIQVLKNRNGGGDQDPILNYANPKYYIVGSDNTSTVVAPDIDLATILNTKNDQFDVCFVPENL